MALWFDKRKQMLDWISYNIPLVVSTIFVNTQSIALYAERLHLRDLLILTSFISKSSLFCHTLSSITAELTFVDFDFFLS